MAAALLRGGAGLCVRCIHRELCRLVWRPQTASFSSKQSDRKPPRRTHIKKAKPQPAVDVAKLLEQLFPQRRPSTAPPAGTARPAQASTRPTGPPATSSTSTIPPAASSVKPAGDVSSQTASAFKAPPQPNLVPKPKPKPPVSHETTPGFTQASTAGGLSSVTAPTTATSAPRQTITSEMPAVEPQTPAETTETKAEAATEAAAPVLPTSANVRESKAETSALPAATVERFIEPTAELESVVAKPFALETLESEACVAQGAVEPSIEAAADTTAQAVRTNGSESGGDDLSHAAAVEATVDTSTVEASASPVETSETGAAMAEGTVESLSGAAIDAEAEVVSANSTDSGADRLPSSAPVENTEESGAAPLMNKDESAEESGVSSSETVTVAEIMTLESVTLAEAEAAVESLQTDDLLQTTSALDERAEKIFRDSGVQTGSRTQHSAAAETEKADEAEDESLAQVLSKKDSLPEDVEALKAETDILMEELLCSAPDLLSKAPSRVQNTEAHEAAAWSSPMGANGDAVQVEKVEAAEEEAMTLDSVTLAEVTAGVGTMETEALRATRNALEKEVEMIETMEVKTSMEDGRVHEETKEAEILTLDSLTEAADALEAETSVVLEAMFCSDPQLRHPQDPYLDGQKLGPEVISQEGDVASRGQERIVLEAMTLESITLADVEAGVGAFDTEVLQEMRTALEKEAEMAVKEEKMEVKTAIEEETVSEETKEAEILTLDSLTEAADALEAETSVVLEAMFCSDPQLRHPQDPYLDGQKLGPEVISQEGDVASRWQEGGVLEAMTLDSVTLAEAEASLGGLEKESLSEATAHLEREAEALAQEEKVEVDSDAAFEEMNEALTVESLSRSETGPLPEALQTEAQVEELLFSIPGHVAVASKALVDQEAVKDNKQDGEVVRETPVSDEAMVQTKGGEEEVVVREALTLESLMISEVNPLMETLEMDGSAETITEMAAETQVEQTSFGEAAEPNVLTEEEEILTKVEVLVEAVDALEEESLLVQQTLTCPVSGTTAAITTTGSAAGDAAGTETDAPPGHPAAEDTRPGQEDEGTQTGAVETLDSTGTQTDLDPVQRLFLEKIREYNELRGRGGTAEVEQDHERLVSEETAKLQRQYGGGDLSSFPRFTFSEPKLDQDSK